MSGRLVSPGIALAVLSVAVAVGAALPACYDVPRPDCGFACGPDGACPDGYRCAADRSCHRIGTPADLVCMTPDARLPADAAVGARSDAAGTVAPDARQDAAIDATTDAPPDAAVQDRNEVGIDVGIQAGINTHPH